MSAVLRIALTYFEMLPLQRWLNLAGLLLFAGAVVMGVFGEEMNGAKAIFMLCTFGITLTLLVPGFGGGVAMRMASRPTIVHLRPHGRLKLLLGSTLAMTLLALVATIPALATHWFVTAHELNTSRFPVPLSALLFFWPVAALGWIIMFSTSRTTLFAVAFPVIPLGAMKLPMLYQKFPAFTPIHMLVIAAGAWMIFSLWYLRAARVRPPVKQSAGFASIGTGPAQYQWLMGHGDDRPGADPQAQATACFLLGTSSNRVFTLTGLWTAVIFVAVSMVTPKGQAGSSQLLLFMMPFLGFHCATMGFSVARRARLLWLRNGADRDGLFSLAEKLGLRAALITWGIVAGAATVFMLVAEPRNAQVVLLFIAAQCLVAVCMFYVGMAMVKNWGINDVALCIGFLSLLILQMIFAHPIGGVPPLQPLITLLAAGALLLPLRWHAHRLWAGLDWRLIKPPRLDWRRN